MVKTEAFGRYAAYVISDGDLSVTVTALGATVTSIKLSGTELTLGYETPEEYLAGTSYIGAFIGRFANRIGGGRFPLDGRECSVSVNEGANTLHGGVNSWDKREWTAEILSENSVKLSLESPDGDNGFPGKMTASVVYTVSDNALRLDFGGVTDAPTVYAPTTHIYFTLGEKNVLDFSACINAFGRLEAGEGLIPTGAILPATDAFDFTAEKKIARNFDDCFVLFPAPFACRMSSSKAAVTLKTDFPALQFYTGGALEEHFGANAGFAIEPEFYPDAVNHPEWPSCTLRPGESFSRFAEYSFKLI